MGFMDKAKQMAEQAQQKIEETQRQFNEKQAQKAGGEAAGGGGVRYDEHGRPVGDGPPAAGVPGPPVQPAAPEPVDVSHPASDPATAEAVSVPQPAEGVQVPEPEAEAAVDQPLPPPAPPKDGVNATPDPFKPIQ